MRPILRTALIAAIVTGGSGGALAQRAGVESYADEPSYSDEYRERAPRAYRYRSDDDPVVVVPVRPANCGVYRYWNGERCVDARFAPPDLR
jgi:hypothetical protein